MPAVQQFAWSGLPKDLGLEFEVIYSRLSAPLECKVLLYGSKATKAVKMSYSSTKYHRQNGRYYKIKESSATKDILDASNKEALEKGNSGYHDHHFKKDGRWYVQTKIENRHLFEELRSGVRGVESAESGEYLDHLFEELKRL
jgi:excinuclease UvrABC helicase subunit UvrB